MFVGISISGLIFGFLAAFLGVQLLEGEIAGFGSLVGAIAGMMIGYPLGIAIGMFLINKFFHYPGSLLFGFIGVILGAIIPFVLSEPLSLNNSPDILWIIIIILPSLFGAIGFHLRRSKRL